MTVSAVGKNDNSSIHTVAKFTAVGTAAGYSMKYLWKVNKNEQNISDRKFVNLCRKTANENKIKEFEGLSIKSAAQDCFVSMLKEDASSDKKTAFSHSNIRKNIQKLGGENSASGKEFRSLVRESTQEAKQMTRYLKAAQNIMIKFRRPAVPFLVVGAGAGFIAGFMHNVIKTDA